MTKKFPKKEGRNEICVELWDMCRTNFELRSKKLLSVSALSPSQCQNHSPTCQCFLNQQIQPLAVKLVAILQVGVS